MIALVFSAAAVAAVILLAILAERVKRRVGIQPTFDRGKRQYGANAAVTQQRSDRDVELS